MSLSGIKDLDFKILAELDDRDLFSFCLADLKINELLKGDPHFWRNRFYSRFGPDLDKPVERSWRNHYLKVVYDLTKCEKDFFKWITWDISLKINWPRNSDFDTCYRFLELGKEITIYYPIDRYQEMDFIERKYKSDKHFTPEKIFNLVYEFYQEPITVQELEKMQEEDIEEAEDYTVEDARAGKVKRLDLMGSLTFFEGFDDFNDGLILRLGS